MPTNNFPIPFRECPDHFFEQSDRGKLLRIKLNGIPFITLMSYHSKWTALINMHMGWGAQTHSTLSLYGLRGTGPLLSAWASTHSADRPTLLSAWASTRSAVRGAQTHPLYSQPGPPHAQLRGGHSTLSLGLHTLSCEGAQTHPLCSQPGPPPAQL